MQKSRLKKIKAITDKKYCWSDNSVSVYSKYTTKLLGSFISNGNKLQALNRLKQLFKEIKNKENIEAYKLIYISLLKISPSLYVNFVKIAGRLQPIPTGLMYENKRVTFAIKWAVKLLKDKNKTRNISIKQLSDLLCQSALNKGDIIAYKHRWQKTALQNKHKANFLKYKTGR